MKQIIILGTSVEAGGGIAIDVVFWYSVTVGREVPVPGAGTRFRNATAAEITALQNGSVVEESFSRQVPTGTTATQIKSQLVTAYNNRLALFSTLPNPNQYYGLAWDGSVWA